MTTGYKLARKPRDQAIDFAEKVAGYLGDCSVPRNAVHFLGSIRRGKPTVGDLDILVVTPTGCDEFLFFSVLERMAKAGHKLTVKVCGSRMCSVQVDSEYLVELKQGTSASIGAAMLFMTGSGDFNVQMRGFAKATGFLLNQYGLHDRASGELLASATEHDIFSALGVQFIEPAEREAFRVVSAPKHLPVTRPLKPLPARARVAVSMPSPPTDRLPAQDYRGFGFGLAATVHLF